MISRFTGSPYCETIVVLLALLPIISTLTDPVLPKPYDASPNRTNIDTNVIATLNLLPPIHD